MFFTPFWYWPHGRGESPRRLVHNLLMQLFHPGQLKIQITSQRLLDQSQAGVYMGKTPHTPHFGAYSRTLPQGVELLV